jgi:transcriptional regulator with XRE-family HTH domain
VTSEGGSELGQFLRARRERLRPEAVGLTAGERRRVRGLHRHELAMLSSISTEYYVRLEQGRDKNPSMQVLRSLASALGLDQEATAHLYRLSRPAPVPPRVAGGPVVEPPPFGFRLEMGRDHGGIRMQARRSGFVTAEAAKTEYGRFAGSETRSIRNHG